MKPRKIFISSYGKEAIMTKAGKFWVIVAFLGGLFTMLDSGHQLYDDHKSKKAAIESKEDEA
jgi:hypothetical protein